MAEKEIMKGTWQLKELHGYVRKGASVMISDVEQQQL